MGSWKKAVGMLAAMVGMGMAAPAADTTTTNLPTAQSVQDKIEVKDVKPTVKKEYKRMGSRFWFDRGSGMDPKSYGQMLQRSGRQKWTR